MDRKHGPFFGSPSAFVLLLGFLAGYVIVFTILYLLRQ
jgi:hypothetical protein